MLHILVKPLVTLAVSQEFCKLFDLKGRHLMQFCSKILQYNTLLFLVLCQNTKCFCFKNTFSFDDFGRSWIFFIQKIILGGFKNSGKIQKSALHSTQLMMESVIWLTKFQFCDLNKDSLYFFSVFGLFASHFWWYFRVELPRITEKPKSVTQIYINTTIIQR